MINRTILVIMGVLLVATIALAAPGPDKNASPGEKATQADASGVITRGDEIGDSPVVSLQTVAEDPEKYKDKKVIIEGIIETVCQHKGCWMTVVSETGKPGVRVTFKNYGFFVPKDAAELKVRAEGKIKLTELTEEEACKAKKEGTKMSCDHGGKPNEISFVASAVEIFKKAKK